MTKQIDIDNRKGGVGKTTFCIHLAIYLSQEKKKKVLIIDADGSNCAISKQVIQMERDPVILDGFKPIAQSDYQLTLERNSEWDSVSSAADICFGGRVLPYETKYNNLHILPAYSSRITELERSHRSSHKDMLKNYQSWFNSEEVQGNYDFVLIDGPPLKTLFGDIYRKFSDGLVVVVQPTPEGYEGMKAMLQAWTQEVQGRTLQNQYSLLAVQIMHYDKRIGQQKDIYESIKNNAFASEYINPSDVGISKFYQEKAAQRLAVKKGSIFDLRPKNKVRVAIEEACSFIYKKIGQE